MITKGKLKELYIDKGLSTRQVGKELGVSGVQVGRLLKKYGIKARPAKTPPIPVSREDLYQLYEVERLHPHQIAKKYGKSLESVFYWLKKYDIPRTHKAMRGSENPNWKGGKIVREDYILVKQPDHPNADSQGYVREHRLVVERQLGRILTENEQVHHINGKKHDNRPENLEVMTRGQHSKHHYNQRSIGENGQFKSNQLSET